MSDVDLTSLPIAIVPPSSPLLGSLDQLGKLAIDVDARFVAGKNARLQQVGALDVRTTSLESKVLALETLLASIFDETPST